MPFNPFASPSSRSSSAGLFANRAVSRVAMEACGSAHHRALSAQNRSNHNKACCALANKLARIAYACLRDHAPYDDDKPNSPRTRKKTERLSFEMPAGALAA